VDQGRSIADSLPGKRRLSADHPEVFYAGFEENRSPHAFSGGGALYSKKGQLEIYNGELFALQPEGSVELSFWLYVDHRTASMPDAELHLWDKQDSHVERIKLETREVHNVYDKWVRISYPLTPKPGIRYQVLLKGKFITIDDLLIRPGDSNVLVHREGNFDLYNNFPLTK
jgi:predicted outer membrane repeat protein